MEKNCQEVNLRKVAMIGCGFVGSASAFALMQIRIGRKGKRWISAMVYPLAVR